MTKTTRLFILLVLLVVIGSLGYWWWSNRHPADSWAYIPANAVLILESKAPLAWWKDNSTKPVWVNVAALPYSRKLLERLDTLRKLSQGNNGESTLDYFFKNRTLTLSLHVTARDDFDYLFYIPLTGFNDQRWLNEVIDQFHQRNGYQTSQHSFQGITITEISSTGVKKPLFSYIIHQNYLIGSYTPFLVEDAVRTIKDRSLNGNPEGKFIKNELNQPESVPVQLYVNTDRLAQFASVFTAAGQADYFRSLPLAANSITLDLTSANEQISLKGIAQTRQEEQDADWLDIFRNQPASPMRLTDLIPNETAVLYHIGFEDARRLRDALNRYATRHDSALLRTQATLRERYGVRTADLYDWVGREIGLALIETNEGEANRLLLIEAKTLDKAISQLSDLASEVDRRNEKAPYIEQYANVPIRRIDVPEFPSAVFGSLYDGFPTCFYAPFRGYIIFSNHIATLKRLLDAAANGDVWSNSSRQRGWLQKNGPAANFSLFVQTGRAWNLLLHNASPHWRRLMEDNNDFLRRFEQIAIQITRQNEQYETNIRLNFPVEKSTPLLNQLVVNKRIVFDSPMQTPVFVVKNPQDQSNEMLVQDEANQLYFLSASGEVIGKKALEKPLISPIYQVDLYKNDKLEFLFATENKLYLLDRKGFWVSNFPISFPDSVSLNTLAVLDYDQSKEYRFALSDTKGNVYMFDKEGTLLSGWNPRPLGYRLNSPIRHVRIHEKDYLIAMQENGQVQVLNRRGEPYPGFPLQLKTRLSSPVVIEEMLNETTRLRTVTDYGEVVAFDLTGNIRQREQLYRPSRDAVFHLCPEATGKGGLIVRESNEKVALLNWDGNVLFEKELPSATGITCQYYDFDPNHRVFALTIPNQQQTFLFDGTGRLLGNRAVESRYPVSLVYSEAFSKLLVYRASGKDAGIWTLKVE